METVVGMTAIAVALLIGMGALGTAIDSVSWVANSWRVLRVSQKWSQCYR